MLFRVNGFGAVVVKCKSENHSVEAAVVNLVVNRAHVSENKLPGFIYCSLTRIPSFQHNSSRNSAI